MINISLQLNCGSSFEGIFQSKEVENAKPSLCRWFELPVTWQQMDLNLLILSRQRLYCPSVFALLMFEVQLDVTINHDLSKREGRSDAAA